MAELQMLAMDWCEKTFPASLAGFKSKGDGSCSSRNPTHTSSVCLKASLDKAPPLHCWGDGGWGVYDAIDPTEIQILIRCYLYSAKLPRMKTGRVRHSKSDCTENKANTYNLEKKITGNHNCGVGVGAGGPNFPSPAPFFSWLPHFSPFSIAKYLALLRNCPLFPPLPILVELPPRALFSVVSHPPLPRSPRAPSPCHVAQKNKGWLWGGGGGGGEVGGGERKRFFLSRP